MTPTQKFVRQVGIWFFLILAGAATTVSIWCVLQTFDHWAFFLASILCAFVACVSVFYAIGFVQITEEDLE